MPRGVRRCRLGARLAAATENPVWSSMVVVVIGAPEAARSWIEGYPNSRHGATPTFVTEKVTSIVPAAPCEEATAPVSDPPTHLASGTTDVVVGTDEVVGALVDEVAGGLVVVVVVRSLVTYPAPNPTASAASVASDAAASETVRRRLLATVLLSTAPNVRARDGPAADRRGYGWKSSGWTVSRKSLNCSASSSASQSTSSISSSSSASSMRRPSSSMSSSST